MRWIAVLGMVALVAVAVPAAANDGAKLLDEAFAKAINSNDGHWIGLLYAPDAVVYPPDGPALKGRDAISKSWSDFLANYTVSGYTTSEAQYVSVGVLSVGWGQWSLQATPKRGGEPVVMHGRFTSVARNFDGTWFYIADHSSIPAASGGSAAGSQ